MVKNILVTGANGHLGSNTVRSLLKRGYNVTVFVRKNSNLSGLEGLSVNYNYGDVLDSDSFIAAAQGNDVIIHLAAVYKMWGKSVAEIMEPSIIGTKNLFEAAVRANVKKIIYTSSITAIGTSLDPNIFLNEKDWNTSNYLPYYSAKTESEKLAWELSRKNGIPIIVLCPSGILGRYDYNITPSNKPIIQMANGLGMSIKMVFSYIDARDAGELHVLAMEKGVSGERYIASGKGISFKNLSTIVGNMTGRWIPHLPFSRRINIFSARLMELGAKLFGFEPLLTSGMAKEVSHRYVQYDNSKILNAFGYELYPIEETVKDTIRWFFYLKKIKIRKKYLNDFEPDPEWKIGAGENI